MHIQILWQPIKKVEFSYLARSRLRLCPPAKSGNQISPLSHTFSSTCKGSTGLEEHQQLSWGQEWPRTPGLYRLRNAQLKWKIFLTINGSHRACQHNPFYTTLGLGTSFKYIFSSFHCRTNNLHLISWIRGWEGWCHMNHIGAVFDSSKRANELNKNYLLQWTLSNTDTIGTINITATVHLREVSGL